MSPEVITVILGGCFTLLGGFLTFRQRSQETRQKENSDTISSLVVALAEHRQQVDYYRNEVTTLRAEVDQMRSAIADCHRERDLLRLRLATRG